MADDVALALAVAQQIRDNAHKLGPAAARALDMDLRRIENTLQRGDPYAQVQDVLDLQNRLRQSAGNPDGAQKPAPAAQPQPQAAPPAPAAPPPVAQTGQIGERTATTLEAVDFTGFVSF